MQCIHCKIYCKLFEHIIWNCNVSIPLQGLVCGSYARGDANEKSDIDIAVEITGPMGLSFVAMAEEIEALFGTKTDVVPSRSIKPEYLPFVEKDIVYV